MKSDDDHVSPEQAVQRLRLKQGQASLVASAGSWMQDALIAWANDDFGKVAALASLAVEHLGKAALWQANPVLLVPLAAGSEFSLVALATKADLTNPKLRTIGLLQVLTRLEYLLGGLPIDHNRRRRMVAVRNAAVHAATSADSRHVLLDALVVCRALLDHLQITLDAFFDVHLASVAGLLREGQSEIGHRVAAKRARAGQRYRRLQDELDEETFNDFVTRHERALSPSTFGRGFKSVAWECPECGCKGFFVDTLTSTSTLPVISCRRTWTLSIEYRLSPATLLRSFRNSLHATSATCCSRDRRS